MKETTNSWIKFASNDLETARYLLQEEIFAPAVLFHSQQAAEKIIKALLCELDISFPKIHNLITLFSLIPEPRRKTINIESEHLKKISDIYTDTRYPGDIGLLPDYFPTMNDAKEIFELAENAYQIILNNLPSSGNQNTELPHENQ